MAASLGSALLDICGRFDMLLVESAYIKERHPILLHALAHARFSAVAVVRGSATGFVHGDSHMDGAAAARNAVITAGYTVQRVVEALDLVAQAQDINGLITVEALQALTQAVSAASRAVEQGALEPAAAALALDRAISAGLHTRFEQVDPATDQLVYAAILDLLRTCLQAAPARLLDSRTLTGAVSACLVMAIDASQPRTVRHQAAVAVRRSLLSFARNAGTPVIGASLLASLHQLVTLLGAPSPEAATVRGRDSHGHSGGAAGAHRRPAADSDGDDGGSGAASEALLTARGPSAADEAAAAAAAAASVGGGGGAAAVPGLALPSGSSSGSSAGDPGAGGAHSHAAPHTHRRPNAVPPILPDCALAPALTPLAVTDDLSAHTSHGTGGVAMGPPLTVTWPVPAAGSGAGAGGGSASPGAGASGASGGAGGGGSGGPASGSGGLESARLRSVCAGTPLMALTVLNEVLAVLCAAHHQQQQHSGGRQWGSEEEAHPSSTATPSPSSPAFSVWSDDRWVSLVRDRLCLALAWLGDGVGWRSGNGSLGGGPQTAPGARGGSGVVAMQLPRLPTLHGVLRAAVTLAHCEPLRGPLTGALEMLLHRVVLRAVSAPSRLVHACAVLLGAPAMRVILATLADAQRQRDALGRALASSSGVHIEPDLLESVPPHLAPGAVVKAITSKLGSILPGADVDGDTVKTLVGLLSPRSPLMVTAGVALDALAALVGHPRFVADAARDCDGCLGGTDVLRAVSQTLAGLALGHAQVHTLHGAVAPQAPPAGEEGGHKGDPSSGLPTPLLLPLPEKLQARASECLAALVGSLLAPRAGGGGAGAASLRELTGPAVASLRGCIARKRSLQACARVFNAKPKRGVEALRAAGLLEGHPSPHAGVAALLHDFGAAGGFHPVAVGEYLGSGADPEDDAKRRAHVAAYADDFTGESLVTALRIYLRSFRLPGEAQQIDRILNAFASAAHTACRESASLASIDATYLLCFSIIMLNTDLHNPNIKPEKRMSQDAFLRNNAYYGDDISHGRRIPEATLGAIYATIRDAPIAPPPACVFATPLLAPGGEAHPTPDNLAAAASFAGAGEQVSLEDWRDRTRGRLALGASPSLLHPHRVLAGLATASPSSSGAQLFALHAAAVPEVWHAAVRVALASFTALFADHAPEQQHQGGGRGKGAAGARGGSDPVPDSVIGAAQGHLQTLVTCASLAERYGLPGGVDVIVAALTRIALHTLAPLGATPGGEGAGPAANHAAGGGPIGWEDDLVHSAAAQAQAQHQQQAQLAASGGGEQPSSQQPAAGGAAASGGGNGSGRIFMSRHASAPAGLTHASAYGAPGSSPFAPSGSSGSLLSRSLSVVGYGGASLVAGGARGGSSGRGVRGHLEAIGASFACDLRGQMALSAVLAIASPAAQGGALSEGSWGWVLDALQRLARVGFVDVASAGTPHSPPQAKRGQAQGRGGASSPGLPPPPPSHEASQLAAAASPSSSSSAPSSELRELLAHYAVASARYRHKRRAARAAVARQLVDALHASANAPASATAGEGHHAAGAAPGAAQTASGGPFTTPTKAHPAGGAKAPSSSGQKAASGAQAPGQSGGNSGIGALFSWLLGIDSSAEGGAQGEGGEGGGGDGEDPDGGEGGPELDDVLEEEPDDDSDDEEGESGEGEAEGGGSAGGAGASPPGDAGDDGEEGGGSNLHPVFRARLARRVSALCNRGVPVSRGGVRVIAESAAFILRASAELPPHAVARMLAALLSLAGCPPMHSSPSSTGGKGSGEPPMTARSSSGSASSTGARKPGHPSGSASPDALMAPVEGARYRCGLLPPPLPHGRRSCASRVSLALLQAFTRALASSPSSASTPASLVPAAQYLLECAAGEAVGTTRRLRASVSAALDVAVPAIRQHASAPSSLGPALRLLASVAALPPPFAGAARVLLAAAVLRDVGAHPQAYAALRSVPLPQGCLPPSLLASVCGHLNRAAHVTGSRVTVSPSSPPLSCLHVVVSCLAAASVPCWGDDEAEDHGEVGGSRFVDGEGAHDAPETAREGGSDSQAVVTARRRAGSAHGPHNHHHHPAAGDAPLGLSGSSSEDVQTLELATATAARMALDAVAHIAAAVGPQQLADAHAQLTASGGTHAAASSGSAFVSGGGVLEALAVFAHAPVPSVTITADDVACQALDELHHAVRGVLAPPSAASGEVAHLSASGEAWAVEGLSLIAAACTDGRPGVRMHALERLMFALLALPPEAASPAQWGRLFDVVLFPTLTAVQAVALSVAPGLARGPLLGAHATPRGLEPRIAAAVTRILAHAQHRAAASGAHQAAGSAPTTGGGAGAAHGGSHATPSSSSGAQQQQQQQQAQQQQAPGGYGFAPAAPLWTPARPGHGSGGATAAAQLHYPVAAWQPAPGSDGAPASDALSAAAVASPPGPTGAHHAPRSHRPSIRCERTLALSITVGTKVLLHALPALKAASTTGGAGAEGGSELVRLWRVTLSHVDSVYAWASSAQPPVPSLLEALEECARNFVLVVAAEMPPPQQLAGPPYASAAAAGYGDASSAPSAAVAAAVWSAAGEFLVGGRIAVTAGVISPHQKPHAPAPVPAVAAPAAQAVEETASVEEAAPAPASPALPVVSTPPSRPGVDEPSVSSLSIADSAALGDDAAAPEDSDATGHGGASAGSSGGDEVDAVAEPAN